MTTVTKTCRCGKSYQARQADLDRGWAQSCSKRCAAKKREAAKPRPKFKNRPATPQEIEEEAWNTHMAALDDLEMGWDGHKNSF